MIMPKKIRMELKLVKEVYSNEELLDTMTLWNKLFKFNDNVNDMSINMITLEAPYSVSYTPEENYEEEIYEYNDNLDEIDENKGKPKRRKSK